MTTSRTRASIAVRSLVLTAAATALLASSSVAVADQRGADPQTSSWGQDYGGAHQWRNGDRIGHNDWNNAQPVDYRAHHLRQPPDGYEWRESNGQYVLAAVATGVIASIILDDGH